jgi:Tol biopolymer transport system component/DNA-binding winged helix-turn-helix (wHTH) protein
MSNLRNHFYEFGPFRLDLTNRLLLRDGEVVPLKKKAFETLLVLVENSGQVLEKETLMRRLWPDTYVEESNLTHYIYALRRVLGDEKENPRYIVTLPGRGYRFSTQVKEHRDPDPPNLVDEPLVPLLIEKHSFARVIITEEKEDPPVAVAAQFAARTIPQLAPASATSARAWKRWGVLAALALGLVAAGFYWWRDRTSQATPGPVTAKIVPFTGLSGREAMPAFSPDGRQIIYSWNPDGEDSTELYVKLIGTGEPVRLTNKAGDEYNPAWSPDGKFIAFLRGQADYSELFVMPSLGGSERKLCDVQSSDAFVTWTPDGRAVLTSSAVSTADKERQALLQVTVESGAKKFLTEPQGLMADNVPRFSPDGKTLAFRRALNAGHSEIFLARPDGSQTRQLTKLNSPIHGFTWTPDGREIVLATYREGNNGLWRVAIETGATTPIEVAGRRATHPAFSAQGTLAYVESLEDANIWRIDLTGRNLAPRKFLASRQADHSPEYAPDGRRIAFSSGRSGHDEVWVCQSDGSNPVQLTHFNGLATGSPHWSPDSKQLVFDARPENHGDLFVIDADGGQPQRLTSETSHDVIPSWSHDGQWLYFCSNRSGKLQIWKRPFAGGAAVQLTQQGGMEAFEAPDGKTIYYLKGRGIAGLWRVNNDGTREEPVPELAEAGYWRYWTINRSGLYFVAHNDQFPYQLKHFDFATRQTKTITTIDKLPAWLTPGLAVAPDGRQILFASNDLFASSILLLENFR